MGKIVLIVDDVQGIVILLEELLTSAGYETITASTGPEALQKLQEAPCDVIILDYQLPLKNGLEVIHETSDLGIKTPVIMMTGMAEKIESDVQEEERIVAILNKPFDIEEVLTFVESCMDTYKVTNYS
ncbi:MAG TPA: response regulator [Bacillota bacterium]|nr:response regulator [Bacillota bacterium]